MNITYDQQYWDKKIDDYAKESWSSSASPFAVLVQSHLKNSSKILELGAGIAQDGLWFAKQANDVIISDATNTYFENIKQKAGKSKITLKKVELTKKLPFKDASLDAVYAHLVLHYFDDATMHSILDEIFRVLKPGGIFACLVNSQSDPEYIPENADSNDIIVYKGVPKRYFTTHSLAQFMDKFEVILLDNKGRTPKDDAVNTANLIQFIGKKKHE